MNDERPAVLVLLGCFQRGLEATGPNQSMLGMAEKLADRFRFSVVAEARPGDVPGQWTRLNGIEQLPLSPGPFGARGLRQALKRERCSLLMMNGFFDRQLTIPALIMRRTGLVPRTPALLAPRGEFSGSALALGAARKRSYLKLAQAAGLLNGVSLQATTPEEADRIRAGLPWPARILVGPNVRPLPPLPPHRPRQPGEPLRVAFLGRVVPMKNLDFALRSLSHVRGPIAFNLYGPLDDPRYWRECAAIAEQLPPTIVVSQCGPIAQDAVLKVLADHDLFFLPSRGENYGHAIVESLAAGTPILISDRTPWHDLAADRAGWDLPLDDPRQFATILDQAAAFTDQDWGRFRAGARARAEAALGGDEAASQLARCIHEAMNWPSPASRSSGATA
jgi:glycosyltransferase involved in cell wall biosynthesis